MALINHDISTPNDGLGDELRTAFDHQNQMNSELYDTKVDKITGKGLSANDFTNTLLTKLNGIEAGAEVNVQPDWNQTDDTQDDYIKNKPAQLLNSAGYYSYLNTLTAQTIVADVELKLLNNGAGVTENPPYGVISLWNSTTNQFDFNDLTIGDLVTLSVDFDTTNDVKLILKLGDGNELEVSKTTSFAIENTDIKTLPTELYVLSASGGTISVVNFYVQILRKGLNLVDITNDAAALISTDASNAIELGTDGKLFSSGGGGGTLQTVTDEGNTTTNAINVGVTTVKGTGTTSSTKALIIRDSAGTEKASINDAGDITANRNILGNEAYLNRFSVPVNSDGFTSGALANYIKPLTANWEVKTQMKYLADYSANYDDRSLVDKAYVDSVVVSSSGDMTKAVYDTDDDGIVDSAKKEMVAFINKSGATITKGTIVYLKSSSSSASYPEVLKANATTEATSSKTIGAVYEDVANDATGYVVTSGEVSNLDTSAYVIGDKLWLSTTDGLVTTTAPTQPNHAVFIGTVTRSQSTNGRILYAIQNGYELEELHNVSDVSYSTPIDTDSLLIKDVTNSLWKRLTWANLKSNLDSVYLRYNQASHFVINDVTDSSAVTGTTAETIAKTYTIDGNSFTHSYVPKLFLYAQKTNTNAAFTIREYMSNTNNFATAINTAIYTTTGGTVRGVPIERMFRKFIGTNLYTQLSVQSTLSDNIVTANAGTTLAINQANTIYVWYTLQNVSASDSTIITMVNLID